MRRKDLAAELVALIGPAATLIDARDGWPAYVDLDLDDGETTRLAIHVAPVSPMNRGGGVELATRPDELRFQYPGPGRPTQSPRGREPMLIGVLPRIDGDPPALVVAGNNRTGQATRPTIRFPGSLAYQGARSGFAFHASNAGEDFWAISPRLLPALYLMRRDGVAMPATDLRIAVQAAGPLTDEDDATKERAKVASTRLARDATFRQRVLVEYGDECALCGLALPTLLQAAHLLPVSLPGSSDATSNGVPACLHHHALLDDHLLFIDPDTFAVALHPDLSVPSLDPALAALAATTKPALTIPGGVNENQVSSWLKRRYEAYFAEYAWAA